MVAGKKRRLTFFECPTDPCSMLDLAKTADLVLLMVDGSFGFELETFEYLNMLQTHGFPKVMGLLTHLDKMKSNKSLNKTKKRLKARYVEKDEFHFTHRRISIGRAPTRQV